MIFSSHVMDVVERLCDTVAVLAGGAVVFQGPLDDLRGGRRLQDVFVELVGGDTHDDGKGLGWFAPSPP